MTLREVPVQLVTREQLAERMGVSVRTVDRLKAEGMPHVTYGRRLTRFSADEALAWALNRKEAA